MASMESETPDVLNETRNANKKKNGIRMESFYLRKIGFGCFRVQQDEEGNFDMEVVNGDGERRKPTHLLIMVNGLVGRLLHFLMRFISVAVHVHVHQS